MTIMANGENKQSFLRKPWVVGVVLSTLLMASVALYSGFSYATNDDKFILQSFLGFQPGGPVHFSMFVRTLIAWPLFWLGTALPGIAWFSILQLILIWLANAIISKSIIQCFDRYGKTLWCGVSAALLFLMVFTLYSTARITFTVTAALLGAAAVAHLLSMDCAALTDRQYIAKAIPSVLLLGLAYSLRSISLLPALGYCGIIIGGHALNGFGVGKYRKRSWRPIWISVLIGTAVLGCLFGARQLEINLNGRNEYVQWQKARASVLDYLDVKELPRTACEQVGWSESKVDLLKLWYTMDESFSTQAFQTIAQIGDRPQTRTSAGAAILDLQTRSPLIVRSLIVLFLLGICCTLWWLLFRGKEKRWPMITLFLTGALCMAMFCYLALQGRLPYRAVLVPVLPAATIVFCLLPALLPPRTRLFGIKRVVTVISLTVLAGVALWDVAPTVYRLRREPSEWSYDTYADMDQQGLSHPDLLLIYGDRLVNDPRLFPDESAGIPVNITFWGGWDRGSSDTMPGLPRSAWMAIILPRGIG